MARRRRRKPVKEISGARVGEYSGVDQPATAIDFLMFKGLDNKADLPGVGSNEPGTMPTGGQRRDLVDLQRCLAQHPDWSPAQCEAAAAGMGLGEALEADMEGDDATVSDPETAGDFRIGKDLKPEAVDACVAQLLEDPGFDAGDFPDRESRAFAICQAQTAGLGGPSMPKQDPMAPEEIVVEGEAPAAPPAVEISTVAVEWPMEQCIVDAKEVLGTDDDGAVQVCSLIRTEFGNMENSAEILLPEGMSTDQALISAAMTSGIAQVGSGEGKGDELEPGKRIKFTGKNRWWRSVLNRVIPPKTPEQKAIEGLRKEVGELQQDKSNARLIQALFATNRMYARQLGLDTSDLDALASEFGLTPAAAPAAPAVDAAATAGVEEILGAAEGKKLPRGKEALPAAQPADVPKTLEDMTPEELRAEIARLQGILGENAGEVETTDEASAAPEELVVVAGTPAAAGAPATADGAPPEGIALIDPPATTAAATEKTRVPAQRKSVAPDRGAGVPALKKSTILGGAYIPAEDRKAVGWKRGV